LQEEKAEKRKIFQSPCQGKGKGLVFRFFGLLLKNSQNNTRNAGRPRAEEKKEPAEEQTGFPRAPFTS